MSEEEKEKAISEAIHRTKKRIASMDRYWVRCKYCAHLGTEEDHPYEENEDRDCRVCMAQTLEYLDYDENPIRGVYKIEMGSKTKVIVCEADLKNKHVPTAAMKKKYGHSCPYFDPAEGYSWETLEKMGRHELVNGELRYK